MKKSILFAGIVTLLVSLASIADAAKAKPVICTTWEEKSIKLDGDPKAEPVAICTDRAKPIILRVFKVVEAFDEGGVPFKVVVGWR